MNWDAFKTYELGYLTAFEALNNQLFQRYVYRRWSQEIVRLQVVNGAGGDGGIEAYALFANGTEVGVQSKWFRQALSNGEFKQIRQSIAAAKTVRPELSEYIICIPHNPSSKKMSKGGKVTQGEEGRIAAFVAEMEIAYPDLKLTCWFDQEILNELQQPGNEGISHYWFDNPALSLKFLKTHFEVQRQSIWLKERYVPELNGSGVIQDRYRRMILSAEIRDKHAKELSGKIELIRQTRESIVQFLDTREFPWSLGSALRSISRNVSTQRCLDHSILVNFPVSFTSSLMLFIFLW